VKIKSRRIILVLLIGLGLIGGTAAFLFFRYVLPVGTGPAGPVVARESFSPPWTKHRVFLVGLGDSVTAGFGARKGYSYFDRLVRNPSDEFPEMQGLSLPAVFPDLSSTNLSISGSTSSEVLTRQLTSLPTNNPDVLGIVVMTTGGNDIIHNYGRTPPREEAMYGATPEEAASWVNNFGTRLEATIAQIESRFPGGCEIFMANIFDPTDGFGDAERVGLPPWKDATKILDAYNGVILQCETRHPDFHVVDIHDPFLGHGIHCTEFWRAHFDLHDPHYWFYANLEDPNERGYDVIRRLFLTEILKDQSRLKPR
jgi:lysophospholipase L1-like esterase